MLRCQIGQKVAETTLYFIPQGAQDSSFLAALDLAITQWWEFGYLGAAAPASWMNASSTFVQSLVSLIPAAPSIPVRLAESFLKLVIGTAAGPAVPGNAAPCMDLITSSPFRRDRGRLFLPGIAASFLEGDYQDRLSTFARDGLTDTWNALPGALYDSFAPSPPPIWVVWLRRRQVGGPLAMPVVATVDRVWFRHRELQSQRLRLPRTVKYPQPLSID